jgi:hypothetical protein
MHEVGAVYVEPVYFDRQLLLTVAVVRRSRG